MQRSFASSARSCTSVSVRSAHIWVASDSGWGLPWKPTTQRSAHSSGRCCRRRAASRSSVSQPMLRFPPSSRSKNWLARLCRPAHPTPRMPASPERESGPRPEDRGSPRYFACLYAPAAQRELLKVLFALEEEIAAAARQGLDHSVAHVRLQWWYEESLRAAKGAGLHPLARAAYAQLAACGVSSLDLSGLIEVTRWDLTGARFPTRSELDAYCTHWACAITVPVARCALPGEPALALAFGKRLGAALCELELIESLT